MYSLFFFLPALLSSVQSSACNKPSVQTAGTNKNYTIQIGEHLRSYTVFLPSSYKSSTTTSSPLILSFHGNGKSAPQQEALDQLSNPLFNTDHIVVYPQGYKNHWQPGPYAIASASDLDFTTALLPHLQATFCIDTSRIYATGKSVGGGFVSVLACDPGLGPQFAAFAPVSGAFYWDTPENHTECDPGQRASGQAPILEFHGLDDTTIPYTGGEHQDVDLPDVGVWAGWWKVRNGCAEDEGPSVSRMFDGNVERIVYDGCAVEHWKISGLGHAWPSTAPNSDNSKGTYLNATPVIMDWFRGHSLG